MEITEVRVRLLTDPNDRLKAVCTITLDEQFVIRDMKIVEGTHGLFVAMPSRKLSAGCPRCRCQNHLRAKHCNECGTKLPSMPIPMDDNGREKAHRDVAHPITAAVREMLQDKVLKAYAEERENEGHEASSTSEGKGEDQFGGGMEEPAEAPAAPVSPVREEAPVEPVPAEVEEEPAFGSGFPAEPAEEPAVESHVPVGEYSSLIADLKGGSKRRGSDEKKSSSDERGPRKRRRRGSRGGGRDDDRKRDDATPRETAPEVTAESAPAETAPPERSVRPEPRPVERAPEPVAAKPAPQPAPALDDACGFGAGLDEPVKPAPKKARVTRTKKPKREVEPPVETKEPQVVAETSPNEPATNEACAVEESDGGFGAGIL